MLTETTVEPAPMTDTSHRMKFFRQSGWMMMATVASGVFMAIVHICSKKLSAEEYSAFAALIQLTNWMMIPGLGLQMFFAQQGAAAITEAGRRQLVGATWAVLRWTFRIWLVMLLVVVFGKSYLMSVFKLNGSASLWLTLGVALMILWLPIFQGLLMGRQNFMWLGWVAIFNGMGRLAFGVGIVFLLHGNAAGLMAGVLLGLAAAVGTGLWQNRDLFRGTGTPLVWGPWFWHVVQFTLGLGAFQFIFSADAIVVQNYLGGTSAAAAYDFGGTLARAIVAFTGPLASVMFPKLVESAARSHKHTFSLMGLTLLGTTVLGAIAAICLPLISPLLIKYGSKPEYVSIMPLMPLFSWAMVPLAMGFVLLNNLLAHSRFKVVLPVAAVAAGYWITLQYFHDSFKTVLETLGVFSTLFLAVCALFTWLPQGRAMKAGASMDQA
jgi:hypothetical protein